MRVFYLIVTLFWFSANAQYPQRAPELNRCYDRGRPTRCVPDFVNAAFEMPVEATSTCGLHGPSEYCVQTGSLGVKRACEICDNRDPRLAHPPTALTDLTTSENETWWQSVTMDEGVQYPNQVNLTLNLNKAFDITYIRLKFHSPRPESFAIYKRIGGSEATWVPYQFYSATCRDFYGLPDQAYVYGGNETRALCTSEFSDISPLNGGNVAFSTLEGRPSAYNNFENSQELQDWVTATALRITLDRLNTFGDEVFGDEKVHRSYFYAISDFAVGGVCKCNGHAYRCIQRQNEYGESKLTCDCQHNTDGVDCEKCLPFYNDQPWGRASSTNVNECKACNCNGFSNRCSFNESLYDETGHGGYCEDCAFNRDGPNCERCKPNYYQRADGYCIPCYCNSIGSRNLQCNSEGKCQCQPGVGGDKCDQCMADHWDYTNLGCKECSCNVAGSKNNEPNCTTDSGKCSCKENVEGDQCSQCKPGYFNLDLINEFGCTPCFCNGRSVVCTSAHGFGQMIVESIFAQSNEQWTAVDQNGRTVPVQYNSFTQNVEVRSSGRETVYFLAPDRFIHDQRGAYNQELNFTLRIGDLGPRQSSEDIILEGNGLRISRPIFGYGNYLPSTSEQEFTFRLHEDPKFGWNPRLTSKQFMSLLADLSSIKIRGTYTPRGTGFLDNIKLKTAKRGASGAPAPWIEKCTCPEGYIGNYCEECKPKYTLEPKSPTHPFGRCVPCSCNGHTEFCDPITGHCICEDNTAGDHCERCARGYYKNATFTGAADDCKECPCPFVDTEKKERGSCIQLQDLTVVCLECPIGYAGPQCEFCGDGFFGDPEGQFNEQREKIPCMACICNDNIDPNAIGNCNRTTGECLKCTYNTAGRACEKCLPGFFGDPFGKPSTCKSCECNSLGTIVSSDGKHLCDQVIGQCPCKENVEGRQCDRCKDSYYDIASGNGCKSCECDAVGAVNGTDGTCDREGRCTCKPGIVGLRCTECAPNYYGFSDEGCKPCDCDHTGSLSLQCEPDGQCKCRDNVEGRRCDRCKENKHNRQAGCIDCPSCYNLVQSAVDIQRKKITEMDAILKKIEETPTVISDRDFEDKLKEVQNRVDKLWNDARSATGADDKGFLDKISELRERIKNLDGLKIQISDSIQQCQIYSQESNSSLKDTQYTLDFASEELKAAQRLLDTDGREALSRAEAKSTEYGQQSNAMSEYAKEARSLAEAHEKEASEIEKIGAAALNTSTVAHDLLWNSINEEHFITEQTRLLNTATRQLEDEVNTTKAKAEEALAKSKKSHDDALALFKDAYSLTLPIVDLNAVKDQANRAKTAAEGLNNTLNLLVKDKEELINEANNEISKTRAVITEAVNYQQAADELLTDLHAANSSADLARKRATDTFNEAKKIYDTLLDFNRNVEESKANASRAKQNINEIYRLVRESQAQARENQDSLRGAKNAASNALADADRAKEIAEKAEKDAEEIRNSCTAKKVEAEELNNKVSGLASRISDTSSLLEESEDLSSGDDVQVKSALEKASDAKITSSQAYEKIQKALEAVRDIQLQLNNLDNINKDGLEGLSRKIQDLTATFNNAGLDDKVAELREARNSQEIWLKNYEDEVQTLKKEVEHVTEIRNSLPPTDKCWKRLKLEP